MEKEVIEFYSTMLSCISDIVMVIIASVGFVIAVREYCKLKLDTSRSRLAKEAYAFYFVEQQAMKRISEMTSKDPQTKIAPKTVQKQLRDAAVQDENNALSLRPKLSYTDFQKFI